MKLKELLRVFDNKNFSSFQKVGVTATDYFNEHTILDKTDLIDYEDLMVSHLKFDRNHSDSTPALSFTLKKKKRLGLLKTLFRFLGIVSALYVGIIGCGVSGGKYDTNNTFNTTVLYAPITNNIKEECEVEENEGN